MDNTDFEILMAQCKMDAEKQANREMLKGLVDDAIDYLVKLRPYKSEVYIDLLDKTLYEIKERIEKL